MIESKVLEKRGVIVCGECKLFMHEHEASYKTVNNGIYTRIVPYHQYGCPAKQEIYKPNNDNFIGDD